MHFQTLLYSLLVGTALATRVPHVRRKGLRHRWDRDIKTRDYLDEEVIPTDDVLEDASNADEEEARHRGYRNVLYVTNWGIYGANYTPDMIPSNDITHIMYSFADILPNGTVVSSDPEADTGMPFGDNATAASAGKNVLGLVNQFFKLKQANRSLKVLLAIGGYTYSPKFAPVAANKQLRANFVSSSVKLMADWGMDGLDIDWEYPNTNETNRDAVSLFKELRTAMDDYSQQNANGYHFLLTMPGPAGPQNYNAFNFKQMDRYLDFWSLMAFDYAGSWDNTTGHQSNIYPTSDAIATKFSTQRPLHDYVRAGVSPSKINLGMPLYGRAFDGTSGLGKPYSSLPNGTLEAGVFNYNDLPRNGSEVVWDNAAKATYSYDANLRQLVTYDDMRSAKYKADYLQKNRIGGAMFWEAAGDKTGDDSIVSSVSGWLGRLEKSRNLLYYPASQYDNIRALSDGVNATAARR